MDFNDITFTIPRANIFSGVEPCLAVVLASIPLMRPLLGRSTYTPEVTGRRQTKSSSSPSNGHKPAGQDGLYTLQDNSSQLCLRPMGPKSEASVAVQNSASIGRLSAGSDESLGNREQRVLNSQQEVSGGISVRKEWAVIEDSQR